MPQVCARDTTVYARTGSFAEPRSLDELSADWAKAQATFAVAAAATDSVAIGREPDEDDEAMYRLALRLADTAYEAVEAYAPRDASELLLKVKVLREDVREIDDTMSIIVGDLERLVGSAGELSAA